jgi:SAM-dependent methyltransferase
LDLGCGTGRFSQGLAERLDATVIGLDPSIKMLGQARSNLRHPRIFYASASAEALPLLPKTVDAIFISMVFHHFTNPELAARECARVLRDRGRLYLRTGSREKISSYPYVPFFPTSRTLLEQRLPTLVFQRNVFELAGFTLLSSDVITQQVAADWPEYADKVSLKADSILVSLDDAEFEAGLVALRSAAITNNLPVTEPIDLLVFGKNSHSK